MKDNGYIVRQAVQLTVYFSSTRVECAQSTLGVHGGMSLCFTQEDLHMFFSVFFFQCFVMSVCANMGKPMLSMVKKTQIVTMYRGGKSILQIAKVLKVVK